MNNLPPHERNWGDGHGHMTESRMHMEPDSGPTLFTLASLGSIVLGLKLDGLKMQYDLLVEQGADEAVLHRLEQEQDIHHAALLIADQVPHLPGYNSVA